MEELKAIARPVALIAALIAVLALCKHCKNDEGTVIEKVVTVTKTDTTYRCIAIPNIVVFREIPAHIDTAAVLRDYFARREYSDTIVNTPEAVVTLNETVENNRITDRSVSVLTFERQVHMRTKNTLSLSADIGRAPTLALTLQRPKIGLGVGYAFADRSFFVRLSHNILTW